jgi:hypothetical protein
VTSRVDDKGVLTQENGDFQLSAWQTPWSAKWCGVKLTHPGLSTEQMRNWGSDLKSHAKSLGKPNLSVVTTEPGLFFGLWEDITPQEALSAMDFRLRLNVIFARMSGV